MKMRVGLTAMCVLSAAIAGCEKKQAATGTATQSNNQSSSGNTPPADDALAALMDHEIPHVSLAAQASVMVRDVADALTDITNVARAEDQLPTLTMFRDEMKNLRDRARALGDPSQDALDILNNKLGPMMMPKSR